MSLTLETMLVGAEIPFKVDMVGKFTAPITMASAAITVTSGAASVVIDRVTTAGSEVTFWIRATAPGNAVFNLMATFSDGSDDGEQIRVLVMA